MVVRPPIVSFHSVPPPRARTARQIWGRPMKDVDPDVVPEFRDGYPTFDIPFFVKGPPRWTSASRLGRMRRRAQWQDYRVPGVHSGAGYWR